MLLHSRVYNAVLALNEAGKWELETLSLLPAEVHPQISVEELIACEIVVKNNPTIQKLARDVGEHRPHSPIDKKKTNSLS